MTGVAKRKVEPLVRAAWAETLNCKELGPESDFFDLGGDSIGALNMLFALGADLGIELPPGSLFENSTLTAFTGFVLALLEDGGNTANSQHGAT